MVQIGAALPTAGSELSAESVAAVAQAAERMGLGELDGLGVDHVYWAMIEPDEQLEILGLLRAAYAERL